MKPSCLKKILLLFKNYIITFQNEVVLREMEMFPLFDCVN